MKKKETKKTNINQLIPELIIKINKYSSKLKDRVKIDSIFREFDSYAVSNFQNFIKLSEQRYKSVKSGNSLNNILSKQKRETNSLSNRILSDNLYLDNSIEKENKKLFRKINKKDNKELYQIRHSIIQKTKNYTKNELKRREKYASAGKRRFGLEKKTEQKKKEEKKIEEKKTEEKNINKNKNKKGISKPKLDWVKHFIKNIIKSKLNKDAKDSDKSNETTDNKEDEHSTKKIFFDNLLLKDNQNINDNIRSYKEYLKDIEKSKDNKISRIINSGNTFGHQYSFKLKDIKLLSYQEEKKEDTKINKKENNEIDIVKLIRYTRKGNKKWFLNNLKLQCKNRFNSFNNKLNRNKTAIVSVSPINIRNKKYLNKTIDDNILNNENSDNNVMGRTSSTAFSNFKNTIKTVRNEAEMVLYISQNFDKKRNTMEGFFKRSSLPKLEEYEMMFKTKNNFRNKNKNIEINLENENVINNMKQNLNLKNNLNINDKYNLKNELVNMDIFEDFHKTYINKKVQWAKEDIKREIIKKKEKEVMEETKKYLKEIKKVKRTPNLYVDPYSKRDDLINNRIKLFTRSLSGPFYSQKQLESKLNDFYNYIELKENQKNKNDEKFSKIIKEEENKRKEQTQIFKLKTKIRNNLQNENVDNDEAKDVKLSYKFISSLKMSKNEDKEQPYKDYKEIFKIIKEKKRNGEYDICNIKNEEEKIN